MKKLGIPSRLSCLKSYLALNEEVEEALEMLPSRLSCLLLKGKVEEGVKMLPTRLSCLSVEVKSVVLW